MEQHEVGGRTVWRLPGSERLLVFLDAELYLDRVQAAEIAARFGTCLFVSNVNAEARHRDYTCNPSFAKFVGEDLLTWAGAEEALIAGLSLSGLAAAHLAMSYPSRFPSALCQSGSFWWQDEWFSQNAQRAGRLWLSVGDRETDKGIEHPPTGLRQDVSQIDSVERAAEALRAQGAEVRFNLYQGGHDPACWREELPEALAWLTGTSEGSYR